eukprot:symbB.v1.2.013190.t1/scaffold927.1/size151520/10
MATVSSPSPLGGQDLYALLEVDSSVKAEDLRLAYRRAIRKAHPDKGGSSEAFLAVCRAFDVLSNAAARHSYDQERTNTSKKRGPEVLTYPRRSKEYRLQEKLSNLCQLLQSMDASDRKTSISTLPLKIRGALTKFMEDSGPVTMEKKKHLGSTSIRLRAVNGKDESGAICKKYSAQLDLDSLRSYTRNMVFDLALEHQMILSDLRDQLIIENADNPDIWSPPFKVCDIFDQVLASHQTSAAELGLSTFVQLRATEWVGNRHSLTSPVLSFRDAVALRFRLLSARTWPELRQEWLQMLQCGRRKIEEASAIALVDDARHSFIQQKLESLVKQVEQMLADTEMEAKEKEAEPQTNSTLPEAEAPIHLSAEVLKIHTAAQERKRKLLAAKQKMVSVGIV